MKKEISLPTIILFLYAASIFFNVDFSRHLLSKTQDADIIQRVFGNLRVFVGDWAFMKAEEYHHRGLPFEEALTFHQGESILDERATRQESGKAHTEHAEVSKADTNLYTKLYSQVKVTGDSHLKPEDEKEVLPWFYTEVAFNPNDVRGYILGSYWLERVGDKSACIKFLKEGEKNNPNSAEILGAIGEFYYKKGDNEKAVAYLSRACDLWVEAKGVNVASNKYEESDRLFAFDLLADMYTKKGAHKKALQLYRELLKFGANPAVSAKIAGIEGNL